MGKKHASQYANFGSLRKQEADCRLVQGTVEQAQIRHKTATAGRKARQGNEAITPTNKSKRTVLCPLLD